MPLELKDIWWVELPHVGGDDFVSVTAQASWPYWKAADIFFTSALTLVIDPAPSKPAVTAVGAGIISVSTIASLPDKEDFGYDAWQWKSVLYRPGTFGFTLGVVTSPHRAAKALFTLYFF